MKKSAIFVVLVASLLLSACSSSEVTIPDSSTPASDTTSFTDTSSSPETSATTTTVSTTTTTTISTTTIQQTTTTTPQYIPDAPLPDDNDNDEALEFSHTSGIYQNEFSLTITSGVDGTVYYTTDGSDPTISKTALAYKSAISVTDRKDAKNVVSAVDPVLIAGSFNKVDSTRKNFDCEISAPADKDVDKCTVIRAAVKKADGTFTEDISATYFIGTAEQHIEGLKESCNASGNDLAVISISMAYEDLFDSKTGIYVKGDIFEKALAEYLEDNRLRDGETARSLDANYKQKGREWERECNISFMEFSADGSADEVLNQNCGIRIQGNYSRSDLQKGFRLYARNDYSDNNFRYAVFGEDYLNDNGEVMDKFKNLVLRAGGNCAFTAKFNDTYWQSLLQDTQCEAKHSRPCVVYLNGEYWGLYVLEEDYDDDYLEDVHGVDKSDVVIYKGDAETYEIGYKLDEGELPEGAKEDYYFKELKDFFKSHKNLKSDADYKAFIKLVDPDSVRDYFAVQCWINNKWDWPGKNWSMWKTTKIDSSNEYADGRWRFMFYDMEFGGVSGGDDARTNTIKEDNYKPNGLLDMDTDNPAVLCFAYLMTNDTFRQDFYDRLTGLAENEFEKTVLNNRLDYFIDSYSPLYDQFFDRYKGTGDTDGAVNGGYASAKCIRDFISKRDKYINKMIKYCDSVLN